MVKNDLSKLNKEVLNNILSRAHYLFSQMIYQANHRNNTAKGDPKTGGHPAACASALHILGALHLIVKTGFDHIANKPHASPADHSLNYLLDLFLKDDLSKMTLEECNTAMNGLRAFSENGEPVFQSYHSAYDPDRHNFFPSGTVGIPPVKAGYLAHAYHFAKDHGFDIPSAHFWSIIGDSEFREGSLFEAIPDFAEREIGNLTWIVDYNRQSLDGHRITNKNIMNGTDDVRIERTMKANGWHVIQVRHGKLREELFTRPGGDKFKVFLEETLEDYELQALLLVEDIKVLKKGIVSHHPELKEFMSQLNEEELSKGLRDFGGHDIISLAEAMIESKQDIHRPTMIIAHTIKGWGLKMAAAAGNHSSLPTIDEINELKSNQKISPDALYERFDEKTSEGKYLKKRGEKLYSEILKQNEIKEENKNQFLTNYYKHGEIPAAIDINLKMASFPHTQWMLGQITAKLSRIANTPLDESQLKKAQKALTADEKAWKLPG